MKCALITLSREGALLIERLAAALPGAHVYLHEAAAPPPGMEVTGTFSAILPLTAEIFSRYEGLVYIAPCGVVVRAIAPHVQSKYSDPAVVVVDALGRYAISLLSGHEGGANALANQTANILNGEPVITTTTEALKDLILGIGCRRGVSAERIIAAIDEALTEAGGKLAAVRYLASVDIKSDEEGLIRAAGELNIPLRFISSEEIRGSSREFSRSPLAEEKINVPAVAEPAALLAGRRTQLILSRRTYKGITVAVAKERSLWSASDPADRWTGPGAPKKR